MKTTLLILVAVRLLSISAYAQNLPGYIPVNGLAAWWPFNGNANDESGNGNNGVVNGATLTADRNGAMNSAYSFDGNFDYIDCGASSSLGASTTQDLSISAWFFTQSNGNLLSKYLNLNTPSSNYAIICNPSNSKLRITGNGVNYVEDNTVNFGQWLHVVAIFASGTNSTQIFINGALTAQGTLTLNSSIAATPFMIGMISGSFPGFFDGFIDDVGVWNRALTQQEVTNLYNASTTAITEVGDNPPFSIYPNPATDKINISTGASMLGKSFILYDVVGRVVGSGVVSSIPLNIPVDGFYDGLYSLVIDGQYRRSFTVAR